MGTAGARLCRLVASFGSQPCGIPGNCRRYTCQASVQFSGVPYLALHLRSHALPPRHELDGIEHHRRVMAEQVHGAARTRRVPSACKAHIDVGQSASAVLRPARRDTILAPHDGRYPCAPPPNRLRRTHSGPRSSHTCSCLCDIDALTAEAAACLLAIEEVVRRLNVRTCWVLYVTRSYHEQHNSAGPAAHDQFIRIKRFPHPTASTGAD